MAKKAKKKEKYDYDQFNNVPGPNFREITEKEFAQSDFFTYGSESKPDLRQITNDENKTFDNDISLYCFYMRKNEGFGISHDYWAGKIKYYAWGCAHDMMEIEPEMRGRCIHTYKCKKCGYTVTHDSSD